MDFINTLKKVTKITNFASSIDYVTLRFIPALTLVCGLVMTYKQYAKSSISCYSSSPASGNGLVDFVKFFCYFAARFTNYHRLVSWKLYLFKIFIPFYKLLCSCK